MKPFVLYTYFRSSASYRVRIALNLKSIDYEPRFVHLLNNGGEQFSEEYKKINPSREVPALVHDGKVIAQSVAIIDYLDRVHSEKPLFPRDIHQRALVLQACEIVNSGIQPLVNLRVLKGLASEFNATDEQKTLWSQKWISLGLESLEGFLKPHASNYCFGNEVTAADCFAASLFLVASRNQVSLDKYPTLARIHENLQKLDAVKKAAPDQQPDAPKT